MYDFDFFEQDENLNQMYNKFLQLMTQKLQNNFCLLLSSFK